MLLSDKTAPGESSKLSHQLSILEASGNAENGQVHINSNLLPSNRCKKCPTHNKSMCIMSIKMYYGLKLIYYVQHIYIWVQRERILKIEIDQILFNPYLILT